MTGILLCCAALILLVAALYLVAARPDIVAGWLWRVLRGSDPWSWQARLRARLLVIKPTGPALRRPAYDPEPRCGLDPVDEHFSSVYVESDHPHDCAQPCCWEIRLNELVDRFDWHAYEHEMRKTK